MSATGYLERTDQAAMKILTGGTITSIENSEELASILNERMVNKTGGSNQRLAIMLGMLTRDKEHPIQANIPSKDRSQFSQEKYKFFLDAPFEISNKCCTALKKEPAHRYIKETGRYFMTAEMASESRLRTQKWIQNGCNGFDMKIPKSTPMSFWLEQDVLMYIYTHKLPICSIYGEVVEDYSTTDQCPGQMTISDLKGYEDMGIFDAERPLLKCTGVQRSGCVCCGFGSHLESEEESRFRLLKQTHPGMYNLLDICTNSGVTYREAIEWYNEHVDDKYKIWL
jgi:3'-phosphoadenosine 5'-phosphosulfate sulfotransferase (PAPS reductase)/FAD synthetase